MKADIGINEFGCAFMIHGQSKLQHGPFFLSREASVGLQRVCRSQFLHQFLD